MREPKRRKDLPDAMLIEGYLAGNHNDFDILFDRYKRQLLAYLNKMLPGQHALVDDVFQQTWIKVIHQLPRYKSQHKFLAWIIRIAHNQAIDHYRKNKKREELPVSSEDGTDQLLKDEREPWNEMDRDELGKALKWAIEELPSDLKEVFLLRQDKVSFKEIAVIQDCSINTVLGRMQYAMKNLRRLLSEWDVNR